MHYRQLALILAFWVSASISWVSRPPVLARPPSLGIRGHGARKYAILGSKIGYRVRKNGILPLLSSKTGVVEAAERSSDPLVNLSILVYHCVSLVV